MKVDLIKLEEFAAQNQKRKSIFDDYKKEIIFLRRKNVSLENIVLFLKKEISPKKQKGLSVDNLSKYIKRLKANVSKARENKEFFQNTVPENKKISTAGAVDKKEIQKTEPVRKKSDFVPNTTRKITHTPNTDAAEDLY